MQIPKLNMISNELKLKYFDELYELADYVVPTSEQCPFKPLFQKISRELHGDELNYLEKQLDGLKDIIVEQQKNVLISEQWWTNLRRCERELKLGFKLLEAKEAKKTQRKINQLETTNKKAIPIKRTDKDLPKEDT